MRNEFLFFFGFFFVTSRNQKKKKKNLPLPVGQPHLALRREAVLAVRGPPPQRVHHPQVPRRHRLDLGEVDPVALDRRGARELDQARAVLVVGGAEVARGEQVAELGPVDPGLEREGERERVAFFCFFARFKEEVEKK